MECQGTDKVKLFDSLYTTDHLQILKILLFVLSPDYMSQFAVFIKWQELLCALNSTDSKKHFGQENPSDMASLFEEICHYCSPDEQVKINEIKAFISNLDNIRQMMEMMEVMQEMMPEDCNVNPGNIDFSQISDIMQMYQSMSGI